MYSTEMIWNPKVMLYSLRSFFLREAQVRKPGGFLLTPTILTQKAKIFIIIEHDKLFLRGFLS